MDGLANAEVSDPCGSFAVAEGSVPLPTEESIDCISISGSSNDGGSGSFGFWTLLLLSLFGVRSALANRRR